MDYQRPITHLNIAIPLVLLAALANALMIFLVKIVSGSLSISVILFSRYAITLMMILPVLALNPATKSLPKSIKTERLPLHIFRDVVGFLCLYSYFYAAKFITLADATVLFNTAPLFIPLIALVWQKLKIYHRLWLGIGIGFIGVLLLLHPGKEALRYASFIGLFAGFASGVVIVGNRLLTYTEPPTRTMFYYFVVGTILGFIVMVIQTPHFWENISWRQAFLLLGIGALGYLYQYFNISSTKYAPVRLSSTFLYTTVIFSLFFDWIYWKKTPTMLSAMGIGLIILGGVLLLLLYPKQDYQKTIKVPQP